MSRDNVTCAWCGSPAVGEVEVEPARFRVKTARDPITGDVNHAKQLIARAIVVPACAQHRDITDQGAPPPTGAFAQAGS